MLRRALIEVVPVGLIDQVLPSDAERPTHLKLMLGTASQKTSVIFEFDSMMSAQEWRRELRGKEEQSTI